MSPGTSATDHKGMRDLNQNRLLNFIRLNAPISRPQLCELSGLSPATVLNLTNELLESQILVEKGTANSSRGRRPALLEIHPAGGYAIGLMIREYETIGVVVNLHGMIVSSAHWHMTLVGKHEQSIPMLAEKVEALITQAGIPRKRLIGVGCALSGFIDSERGICIDSWQLGWHHFALAAPLAERLQLPVVIRNNVSCIACYENLFGRGQGYQHFLTVSIGRGLGLGIVINGDIYGGAMGGAGEFGHTTIVVDGRLCECGKRGCLEAYIAHQGLLLTYEELLRATGRSSQTPLTIEHLLQSAADDPIVQETLRRTGRLLGIGLANLANVLNPECIILTGKTMEFGDYLLVPAARALQETAFSELGRSVQLISEPWIGYGSWARGAAALVLHRLLFVPAN